MLNVIKSYCLWTEMTYKDIQDEHPLLDSCLLTIGELKDIARTKVDSSRRQAWAFTRLSNIGYPQYLRDIDEVNRPRFFSNNLNN